MAYPIEVRLGADATFFSFVNSAHALVETDLCSEYTCWKTAVGDGGEEDD